MAITQVSTPAELTTFLNGASPGDIAELAAGSYGDFTFTHDYADYVIVRAADPENPPQFNDINIDIASFISFDGLQVGTGALPPIGAGVHSNFQVHSGSHHIEILNCDISGGTRGVWTESNTPFVRIEGCNIHDASTAMILSGSDLTVRENTLGPVREDCMRFLGVHRALVENNVAVNYRQFPDEDAHKDFIQWSNNGSDITIRGNVVLPAADIEDVFYQGIFMRTSTSVWSNILIENNLLQVGNQNGIYVEPGDGVTIRKNTVMTHANAGAASAVIVTPSSINVTKENNVIGMSITNAGISGTDHILQYEDPGGAFFYNDYYQNAMAGLGATLEDYRPVPASPAEATVGAYERIFELLGAGGGPQTIALGLVTETSVTNAITALKGSVPVLGVGLVTETSEAFPLQIVKGGGGAGGFPVMAASAIDIAETNIDTYNIPMPPGVESGNLLTIELIPDSAVTLATATGWTQLAIDSGRLLLWKISDGTEGATVAVTVDDPGAAIAISRRFTNHGGEIEALFSSSDDPPSLTPSWGLLNTLWVAGFTARRSDWTIDAAPPNYTGLVTVSHASSTSTTKSVLGSAVRELAAATENPGKFTGTSGNFPHSFTYAIKPAEAAAPTVIGLSLIEETSVAQPVTAMRSVALGQVSETSTANAITAKRTYDLGLISETEVPQPVTVSKIPTVLGLVLETTEVFPITVVGGAVGADGLAHRRKVRLSTITAKISGGHVNMPGLFTVANLPVEMFDADGSFPAQSGGGDIRFTADEAGTIVLPIEVLEFVTNANPALGTATIWVKIPNVRSTQIDSIWCWYNTPMTDAQPSATEPNGRDAVWTDYEVVNHDPGADSTGKHTPVVTGALLLEGPFGNANGARGFGSQGTGITDRIDSGFGEQNTERTYQAWVWPDSPSGLGRIFDKRDSGANEVELWFHGSTAMNFVSRRNTADGQWLWDYPPNNAWSSLAVSYDLQAEENDAVSHLNGVLLPATEASTPSGPLDTNISNYWIGNRGAGDRVYDGRLAEYRIRNEVLSTDWLLTEFRAYSDPATFWSTDAPQDTTLSATRTLDLRRASDAPVAVALDTRRALDASVSRQADLRRATDASVSVQVDVRRSLDASALLALDLRREIEAPVTVALDLRRNIEISVAAQTADLRRAVDVVALLDIDLRRTVDARTGASLDLRRGLDAEAAQSIDLHRTIDTSAVEDANIEARLSGGAGNADPDLSLGGAKSATAIVDAALHNLFDRVTVAESGAGDTEYRCLYFHNGHATVTYTLTKVWISQLTQGDDNEVDIGLDPAGVGDGSTTGVASTVADESTPPAGVTFSRPLTEGGGLDVPDIPPGESIAVWVRWSVDAAAAPSPGQSAIVSIKVEA